MRHQKRFGSAAALLLGVLLTMSACLNPIGFNPELKLSIDTTVVQGEEDWRIKISDSAVLMLVNRSKTIDVTNVIIKQPENPEAADPVASFPNKPARLTRKAQYVQPSDLDYVIQVFYNDHKSGVPVPGSETVTMPLPKPQEYSVYIYRDKGGIVIVDKDASAPADMEDTQDPPATPPQNPEDGEGSSPSVIPPYNRDKMGTFVVMNMTRSQAIDNVQFQMSASGGSKSCSINTMTQTLFGQTQTVPAVRPSDQQSISLGQGSWNVQVNYTPAGPGSNLAHPPAGPKNAVVIPISDPQALRSNYLYFYKTKSGGYTISSTWPPAAGDASTNENVEIEDTLPDGWGLLEITNKSATGTVVEKIRIDAGDYTVNMAFDDMVRFPLPAGEVGVAFKPKSRQIFGFSLPRTITAGQVTKLSYVDYLGNTDELPADEGHGVGMLKIINNSTGTVMSATVLRLTDLQSRSIPYNEFSPPNSIGYNRTGNALVMGTASFPVISGVNFLIQLDIQTPGGLVVVERKVELLNQIVEILVQESDLKDTKRYGSKVVIHNNTDTPSILFGLEIYNKNIPAASAVYSLSVNSPPYRNAAVYALSTTTVPILEGAHYGARVTVFGNGNISQIEKDFLEGDGLWSHNPENHVRTIVITQSDIENHTPPLIEPFVEVSGITGIPAVISSATQTNTLSTWIETAGRRNLNSIALVQPIDATKQAPIIWTITGGDASGNVSLVDGVLEVTSIPVSGNNKVRVQAKIENARGTVLSRTHFTQEFEIELVFNLTVISKPIQQGGITLSNFSLREGETKNLAAAAGVAFNPADAHINGVPITVDHLTWAITEGAGNATLSGSSLTGVKRDSTVKVQATLPAARNGGTGTVTSNIITVSVTPPPPPPTPANIEIRLIHIGQSDTIKSIIVVPCVAGAWLTAPDPCSTGSEQLPHLMNPRPTIGVTGHTGSNWVHSGVKDDAKDSKVKEWFPTYFTKDVNVTNVGTKDILLPWPAAPNDGYLLFFVEADSWTRGYVHIGKLDPAANENYKFLFHPQTLIDNNLQIWMGKPGTSAANKHVPQGTADAKLVIPIGYDDWYNSASIMKSRGHNKTLIHDADVTAYRTQN